MRKMMMKIGYKLSNMHRREEGQSLVEYGLIIALIALVVIAALMLIGGKLTTLFNSISNSLTPTP